MEIPMQHSLKDLLITQVSDGALDVDKVNELTSERIFEVVLERVKVANPLFHKVPLKKAREIILRHVKQERDPNHYGYTWVYWRQELIVLIGPLTINVHTKEISWMTYSLVK